MSTDPTAEDVKARLADVKQWLQANPPTTGQTVNEQTAAEREKIEKCAREAQELLDRGKVMAAAEKLGECEKLIGRSGQ